MSVQALLDSADKIPDGMADHYTEKDGKFILDIDGIDDHPKVRGVIVANKANVVKRDEYKAKAVELEARLGEIPEGFDVEEYLELKAAAVDADDPEKKKAQDEHLQSQRALYEKRIEGLNKKHVDELAGRDEQIAERDGYIDKSLVVTGLKDALLGVGVEPDLLDGAVASLRPSVKVQRSDSGDRKAIVETDLGEIDVPEFVSGWAQTKGKAYLGKPSGDTPPGNNKPGPNSPKTMTRADFDAMSPMEQAQKMTGENKVTVVDAA